MELIVADRDLNEIDVLDAVSADFAYGEDENDFAVEVRNADFVERGNFIIEYGSERGGYVTGFDDTSSQSTIKILGRTWHGLLDQKIIEPPAGSAYMTVSGDANSVIRGIVASVGLDGLFRVSAKKSGVTIDSYTFKRRLHDDDSGRFEPAYTGIMRMLIEHEAKLRMSYDYTTKKIIIEAMPRYDWSEDDEWDSDFCNVSVKTSGFVNHLIALGQGEGASRTRIDLYISESGKTSTTRQISGLDEWTDTYDYPSAESTSKLRDDGYKRLKEYWQKATSVNVDFDAEVDSYDIGDIVGAYDARTGITASAMINKKITRCDRYGIARTEYQTGEF